MLNAHDNDLTRVDTNPIENAVRAAARGPDTGQLAAEWLADPMWLADKAGRQEFHNGGRDRFG